MRIEIALRSIFFLLLDRKYAFESYAEAQFYYHLYFHLIGERNNFTRNARGMNSGHLSERSLRQFSMRDDVNVSMCL